jgi:tetratricopeptide (TPR) repeat protein
VIRARHAATLFAALAHTAYAVIDRMTSPLASHLLHDAARYDAWARAILDGLTFESGAFSQAPLYPYFMAAIYAIAGRHFAAVVAVQVALGVATVALAGLTASRAFGEEAGAWTAWLLSLYGVLAFFETKLLPAALTVFLIALFLALAQSADREDRSHRWLAVGAVLGLLTIASSASLLLIVLTLGWIALDRARPPAARAARAAFCLAAAAALIAPVAARNHAADGGFTLVADNGGVTFWQGNNPIAGGVYSTPEGFSGSIAKQHDESLRLAEAEEGRKLRSGEVSAHWFAKGRHFLASDPVHAVSLIGKKALFAISNTEQPLEYSPRLDANPLRWLFPASFAVIFGLAIAGFLPALHRRAATPALLVVASTLATLLAFYVSARYRLPLVPGLAVMAGAGAPVLRDRLARKDRAALPLAATIVAAVAVSFLWVPLTQGELGRSQDAMTLCDLATAQRDSGRLDDAVTSFGRAIRLDPAYPFAHVDLSETLSRQGRKTEALTEAREAVRLAPDVAEAQFALGVRSFDAGQLPAAAEAFGAAFRLDPASADAGNNLAGTLLQLGRLDEAKAAIRAMRARGLAVDPPLARAVEG